MSHESEDMESYYHLNTSYTKVSGNLVPLLPYMSLNNIQDSLHLTICMYTRVIGKAVCVRKRFQLPFRLDPFYATKVRPTRGNIF